jgi:hypothetical protein
MRLLTSRLNLLKTFAACGFFSVLVSIASADPIAPPVSSGEDEVQQAGMGTDPGIVPILALSVAAITLIRRRIRQ